MTGHTWRPGCPVELSELVKLTVRHWTFEGETAEGILIVHQSAAPDLQAAFREAYAERFPIASMRPVVDFEGDDGRSMDANNTSAFNCRPKTPPARGYSRHAWGTAIDVNPVQNPWVRGERVLPRAGWAHADRESPRPGQLRPDSALVRALTARGWRWGGRWRRVQDYQHLERP